MKKKFLIGLSLFCSIVLNAQKSDDNYLHFDVGGGAHNFLYDAGNAISKDNYLGYTFQAGYSHFFTPLWGIQTGLGMKTFKSATTLNLKTAVEAVDKLNRSYQFRTDFDNWKELENAVFLTIPIEVQYRIPAAKRWDIIAGVGGELDLAVYKKFSSAGSGSIVTTGYYKEWNTELSDLPDYGFSTYTDIPKGDLPFTSLSCSGIADLGGLYQLNDKISLYFGSYMSVGLNNLRKSGSTAVYQTDGTYNGIYSSSDYSTIRPFSFGIKMGVYFNMGKKE